MKMNYLKLLTVTVILFSVFNVYIELSKSPQQREMDQLLTRVREFARKYRSQDSLVVIKSKRWLFYCQKGQIVNQDSWNGFNFEFPAPISLGRSSFYWTPTGEYYICTKNKQSKFTGFMGLSYPSIKDAVAWKTKGNYLSNLDYRLIVESNKNKLSPPWSTPLGGAYGIHGDYSYAEAYINQLERQNPYFRKMTLKDVTEGCVGVENRVAKYLFARVDFGTPVLIMN
jgi:lipoprotein-anchoring transpeptidase ErfK/SrfK